MDAADLRGAVFLCLAAMAQAIAAPLCASEPIRIAVVAPAGQDHFAWSGVRRLQEAAREHRMELLLEPAALTDSDDSFPDILVMPVRSLASRVAVFEILELPFFYPSLSKVHEAIDGELGRHLAAEARSHGWEILAYWDEGMHILSGLKRYDRVRNLKARAFLITRPDPVAMKQFRYWKATAERIDPQNREALLSECLVAGRAASLQEVVREQLYRVHLSMSLTNHRYEGWVVIAPAERWARFDTATKQNLRTALRDTTSWQRNDAREREAAALAELKRRGMTIYEVDTKERDAFRQALPDWAELLSDDLKAQQKRKLIGLASAGAAAVTGPGATTSSETRREPAPGTETRQGDQQGR